MKHIQSNNPEDRVEVNITYKLYPCDIKLLKVWAKAFRFPDWETVLRDHGHKFFDHLESREEDPDGVNEALREWEIARYGAPRHQTALRTPPMQGG